MKRILLVEDDPACGAMVREALTRFQYQVTWVTSGKEALASYDPATTDLVITDLFMPDVDGMELIAQLTQREPGVRILAMSGGVFSGKGVYLPLAEKLGAVKSLSKPFGLDELRRAVVECLDEG
jgi:two-component system, chemotaxis family, chemotaxis protein CheY